jgi:hypothetical protein
LHGVDVAVDTNHFRLDAAGAFPGIIGRQSCESEDEKQ